MLKIKIISVGKTKEEWLETAIAEYVKRLQAIALIECVWAKNDGHLLELVKKESLVVCCDAKGDLMTSEQFSGFLHKKLIEGGSRLAIVIGGAEGLPEELREGSGCALMSLSRMTLTHQMVRLLLVEQIYRAFEIAKGSKYHK